MQLYYSPGTIAIAVAITLEELGLPYEPVRLDFKAGEQGKPAYLALNPKGRVPTLVTDGGTLLTETGAILDYIAAATPEAGLVPEDPVQAAKMRSVMYYIASTMHVNHAHKMRGHRWANQTSSFEDMTAKVPQTMTDTATYFADHCLLGDFVMGDRFSLADPYAFIACNWLEGDGVKMAGFPTITAFLARMRARPSVQAVIAQRMLPA